MVELIYNSTRSPTANVCKGESIVKLMSKSTIMDTNTDYFTPLAQYVWGNKVSWHQPFSRCGPSTDPQYGDAVNIWSALHDTILLWLCQCTF